MVKVSVPLSAVPETGAAIVECEGRRILLCKGPSGARAMADICPHQERSLEGARVRGGAIMCPHHGARFSLEDGKSLSPLTPNGLKIYESEVNGDTLDIELP